MNTTSDHAPDGQHCTRCNGVHNPRPGVTFVTSRTWGTADDRDDEQD
ncbi:hypothetical protein [Mycobacterium asiaticum]|nr:hypothetical protein [Mycobacterium asiaticum]